MIEKEMTFLEGGILEFMGHVGPQGRDSYELCC